MERSSQTFYNLKSKSLSFGGKFGAWGATTVDTKNTAGPFTFIPLSPKCKVLRAMLDLLYINGI